MSLLALTLAAGLAVAATPTPSTSSTAPILPLDSNSQAAAHDALIAKLQAEEKSLRYREGEIKLGEGLALAHLTPGYHYLDAEQTEKVLTDMWGNPPGQKTLGMIFAPGQTPLAPSAWAVILQYDADGYVKDDDAETIKYDKLLKDMQKAVREADEERVKHGYESFELVGWAEKPFYDKAEHKLHWAKELRFPGGTENTLNYNIRVLGRKGVLVLNAVSGMSQLSAVKEGLKPIMASVEFESGNRYSEFNPHMDKVAAYGIAGLVAGSLLAKAGAFKLLLVALLAAKKFIVIGLLAVVAFFRRFFQGRAEKKKIEDVSREIPDDRKPDPV